MDKTKKLLWFAIGFACGWQGIPWFMHAAYITAIAALSYKAFWQ